MTLEFQLLIIYKRPGGGYDLFGLPMIAYTIEYITEFIF